ncbi:MAG: hypothetical protein ACREJU_04355, partial [Nitrospiraceae bacterium]
MSYAFVILRRRIFPAIGFLVLGLAAFIQLGSPTLLDAFDWVPSDEEIRKYRRSWNPFSHGPVLLSAVDIQPKGQLHI